MMSRHLRRVYFSILFSIAAVSSNPGSVTHLPRMVFSNKDTVMRRLALPGNPILMDRDPNTITLVGQRLISSFNFSSPQTLVWKQIQWEKCSNSGGGLPTGDESSCHRDIRVAHKKGADRAVLCGVSHIVTECCEVNLSEENLTCRSAEYLNEIQKAIKAFSIQEGELSALVESATGEAELYITNSGTGSNVGIHKYGRRRVTSSHYVDGFSTMKEQHYMGLMLSRDPEDPLQDKAYTFFREKNKASDPYSETWLPYVSRVCMADIGGPKNNLQASWTSQLNARLYCGDRASNKYYSELVDTATVEAARPEDARVYGLFRNQWGFTAVCVYSLQDIEQVFSSSPFKGDKDGSLNRGRNCVADSTDTDPSILERIKQTSEMERWVWPVQRSPPLLVRRHNYTHILADTSQQRSGGGPVLLYLSLYQGGFHKVLHDGNHSFIIAAYQPFIGHISSMFLQPSSRKLYASSGSELVQMDVTNCALYGTTCGECVLARDPDCGWKGNECSSETRGALQDVSTGDPSICKPSTSGKDDKVDITLWNNANHFMECPVSSQHANYTWKHLGRILPCTIRGGQCLHLIEDMGPAQEGEYLCMLEERGFTRVQVEYRLLLGGGAAGGASSPLLWLCLMVALVGGVCRPS